MAAAVAAPANGSEYQTVYRPTDGFESVTRPTVIRAQTPGYDETPGGATNGAPKTYVNPPPGSVGPGTVAPNGGWVVPPGGQYGAAPGQDPFLGGNPAAPGTGRQYFDLSGPRPYQLYRWVTRLDVGYLPAEDVSRGLGDFEAFELDVHKEYSMPVFWNWIFTARAEFGLRNWSGPQTTPMFPTTELPGDVYRFAGDFQLHTPQAGPWSALVGFTPQINTDLNDNLTSDAYFWDGRGVLFYHASPHVTLVGGAAFWDRVNDQVVPIAGVILSPNDLWEFRLVFPEPRISYHIGRPFGFETWLYARAEYNVEAYQINLKSTGMREVVETEDWRALLGLRWNNGWVSSYVEAGWVFGRDVEYRYGTPGFDIGSGFIARMGIRF